MQSAHPPERQSLLRALMDLASDGLEVIELHSGRFLDANEASCRELGYERDELLALTLFDVDTSASKASFAPLAERPAADGHTVFETTRRRRNGSTYPVEMIVRRFSEEPACLVIAVRNLTERTKRQQAEDALRASEERLRTILEAEPECVKLFAEDCSLIDMNRAGLAMIEADSLEAVVGKDILDVVVPEHRHAFSQLTKRIFAGGSGSLEFEIEGLKGARLWLETHAAPLRDREGRIIAALGITRNITERVAADATRQQLEEQLRQAQKMETVGQLSGGIAHDFNNLLTVIEGHVALLEADPTLPSALLEPVREIAMSSQRASRLTRQLLTVSRRQPMELRELDVNRVVEQISRMLIRMVGSNIEVTVTTAESDLVVRADAGMIDQVLLNLAMNARDAMPGGGRLTIQTSAEVVDLRSAPDDVEPGPFVRIEVADTGTGMPSSVVPRVFEPFFTTKDVGKGTGLGLATAYAILRQHGGWIDVRSEVGEGSTFTIHLPRRPDTERRVAAAQPQTAALDGSETILLVEDEIPIRSLVRQVLTRAGYEVVEAGTGHEALDAWRAHRDRVSLLLTDLVMPDGMSGLDLAGRLLEDKHDLKVIYTSGYSAEIAGDDRRLQRGVNFLAKPYRPPELLRTVRANLDSV